MPQATVRIKTTGSRPPDSGRLGRYEVVRRLATGGMGEVFLARARGVAGFQKFVVIKKILPHLLEHSHFVEGLVREAKLLVMLDHPNIVQVLDLGREGNDYFMAMEFVHGYNMATIAHYCAQKKVVIPAAACGFVALQVLAGLEYAHDLRGNDGKDYNILHRDVSPQNVLISRDGMVKLADFGIAKVLNETDTESTKSLKGKFRYMAPEALDGGRVDRRYDLFAVGILLFEGLCRRHLFGGRSDMDILAQVRETRVPPIQRYHPQVPPPLVTITERALAQAPEDRFPNAATFATALRAALPLNETECRHELQAFVADLFNRPDFPLNKPKLGDLNAVDPDVTRSVLLASDITGKAAIAAGRRRGGSSVLLLWAGFLMISAAVAYLAYAMVLERRSPKDNKTPVIIQVQNKTAARDVGMAPVATVDSAEPDSGAPLKPTTKNKTHRPRRAVTFTEKVGRAAFARAGGKLRRCFDTHTQAGAELSLGVVSVIEASGRVTSVTFKPPKDGATPLGRCIREVAQKIRYPRHDKSQVTFFQPLRIKRR